MDVITAAETIARKRVLVVDDEPQVLIALEDVLSDDYDVLKANSAEEVFNLLEYESDVAVVISDQRMPGMNGDELLGRVPHTCDATRMMVTGYADLGAIIRAVNKGRIFAYVTKPWDREDLRSAVQKCAEQFDLRRTLERERQLLHDLMNSIPDAIYFKDRELRLMRVNQAFATRAHLQDRECVVGKKLTDIVVQNDAVTVTNDRAEHEVIREGRAITDLKGEIETEDGRRFYSTTLAPVRARDGAVVGLVGVSRDVTAREEIERALRRTTRIRSMLGAVNEAIVRVKERDELFAECCRIAIQEGGLLGAAVLLVQRESRELSAAPSNRVPDPFTSRLILATQEADAGDPWSPISAVESGRPKLGYVSLANASPILPAGFAGKDERIALGMFPLIFDEKVGGVLVLASEQEDFFDGDEGRPVTHIAHNIAVAVDRLNKSERLKFLACYDDLTGLPKRELLLDRLRQLLSARSGTDLRAAVAIVDLSRFRHVNETLGRTVGDELLLEVSKRVASVMERGDTVARCDGNAFVLVMSTRADEAELSPWLERALFPALEAPFTAGGRELRVTARVGIALFPSDGTDAESLMRNAEAALAKARGGSQRCLYYAPSMNVRFSEKLTLETRLRRALEERQFVLHYQPKIDLKSGALVGLEALIRWEDPERGLVPPGDFIPALEETGLILDVGAWVLSAAAAQFASWTRARLSPPPVAANVSAIQLTERGFLKSIDKAFTEHPLARGGLEIEITESVFMQDFDNNTEKLRAIRELGITVAIDDFGTGYSSLGYLNRLPVDVLKIDRSFITRMTEEPQDMTLVTTLISLAHALNLKVIAEGVETDEQARTLKLLKCDQIQGYLVGKPRTAGDITAYFGHGVQLWPHA